MDIKNISLLELQTSAMKKDPTTIALCAALDPLVTFLANSVDKTIIIPDIDHAIEEVLDELAWQWHVDFYEGDIDAKRQLVKNAFIIHLTKGTPYAVETLMQTVFGDGIVQEWFEYGGEPYHFKVITTNQSVTGDQANKFLRLLESVKNKRSKLDEIIISLTGELNIYHGGVVHTGDYMIIEQVV